MCYNFPHTFVPYVIKITRVSPTNLPPNSFHNIVTAICSMKLAAWPFSGPAKAIGPLRVCPDNNV